MLNFIKRLGRLFRVSSKEEFKKLIRKEEPKLSVAQIDELIELNRDILVRMGDDAKIEPIIKKRKLHDNEN